MLAEIRRAVLGAGLVAASLVAGPPPSFAASSAPHGHALAGIHAGRARARAAVPPGYTIRNLGAPSGYTYSLPSGFNNTGQIFGKAVLFVDGADVGSDCFVWTGSAFKRLPLAPLTVPGASCTPSAINDANPATGAYEIVGSATGEFAQAPHAFSLAANATGFKTPVIFYAYGPSVMVGVNGAGTALAVAEFNRDTAFDISGLLYSTTTGSSASLSQLQPPTATSPPASHYLIPTYMPACAFGGCAINDRDKVLGYDYSTVNGQKATAAFSVVGRPASLVHLPVQDTTFQLAFGIGAVDPFADDYPIALNDADQLFYFDHNYAQAAVYDIDSGRRTIITVPGACVGGSVTPISMNNLGDALGSSTDCKGNDLYWVWNAAHGTQVINAQIPASDDTIYPLAMNDHGQILIYLRTSLGFDTWGLLDPVSSASKARRIDRLGVQ